MSEVIDKAPASSPLALKDSNPALFSVRDQPKMPCTVTLPGSTNLDLSLFNVTATGVAKPSRPGTVILTLYGRANYPDATTDPANWLPLGSALAEPIGGPADLPENMFMIQGADLLVNVGTGKMQGTFKSNVASNPQAPIDLEHHPGDITEVDPLYVFAIGASFTPTGEMRRNPGRTTGRVEDEALCTLTLASFTVSA